jgi:hypothetical protein
MIRIAHDVRNWPQDKRHAKAGTAEPRNQNSVSVKYMSTSNLRSTDQDSAVQYAHSETGRMITIPGYPIKPRKRRVNRIPFKQTDGGKNHAGFLKENRDCTVRSLALAAGINYSDAHKCCSEAGRRPRQGLLDHGIQKAVSLASSRFGITAKLIAPPHGTFAQMREKYNQGRYIFTSSRHAFAVIDGVLHDSWHVGGRTKVGMIIKIELPEAKPQITQEQINELWDRLNKLEAKIAC